MSSSSRVVIHAFVSSWMTLLVGLLAFRANGVAALTLDATELPQSAVSSATAYYVGQLLETGGASILKYDLDGNLDPKFVAPSYNNVRGLAINQDNTQLWVAHDGGVAELVFEMDDNNETLGLVEQRLYNLIAIGGMYASLPTPHGLCLSPDEASLYVTDPSTHALLQIDLASQSKTVTFLFYNNTALEPMGCVVSDDNDVVWVIHRNEAGLTRVQKSTGAVGRETEPWAQIIAEQTSQADMAGHGIVLWNDNAVLLWNGNNDNMDANTTNSSSSSGSSSLFVSIYMTSETPPFLGILYRCDIMLNILTGCVEFARGEQVVAADLQLDTKTPNQPQLIFPNFMDHNVSILPIRMEGDIIVLEGLVDEEDETMAENATASDKESSSHDTSSANMQPLWRIWQVGSSMVVVGVLVTAL